MSDAGPHIDEALWVDIDASCDDRRHYLVGSAHTFPGRMLAWCPEQKRHVMISKAEIVACSPESARWIAGFLHGSAPGQPMAPDGDYLPHDDPAMVEWLRAVEEFPETGYWCVTARTCAACEVRLLPTRLGDRCPACASDGR